MTAPASFGDALAWLDRHVNLEAIERGVAGRAAAPTLERIRALAAAMGEPQDDYPVIHVTGTNGKGSTTRLCALLLNSQGLSTGTITSPDLEAINERIAYNGRPISDDELFEALRTLWAVEQFALERDPGALPPTWFELVTAAGFRHLSNVAVDVGVIEVGLGGRFDATNIATAAVAVCTNVDLDHTEILGPTRELIAAEKAGIIKRDSIVVCGEEDPAIVEIFAEEAERVGAGGFWRRGEDFDCLAARIAHGGRALDLRTPGGHYDEVYLSLFGAHQGVNAAVALAAVEAFLGGPLSDVVVRDAFSVASVPGRLEIVERRPLIVLDGAHNPAGAAVLGRALDEDFAAARRVVVVMGCLRGRDPGELLTEMGLDRIGHVVACEPASPRAETAEAVGEAARRCGLGVSVVPDVEEALVAARELVGEEDLVCVTGSLYTVGAARAVFRRLGSIRP